MVLKAHSRNRGTTRILRGIDISVICLMMIRNSISLEIELLPHQEGPEDQEQEETSMEDMAPHGITLQVKNLMSLWATTRT